MQKLDISGIYCIRNKVNNNIYIGSAKNIRERFNCHSSQLKRNIHHSKYLQNAFNKYGEEEFVCYILAKCPPEYLIKLEQWFINNLKPEYNICQIAGNTLGIKQSPETIEKNRKAQLGKKLSQETINKRVETVRKDVHQYDLDGNYINTFHGVKLAGEILNIPYQSIINCCTKGTVKQVGGFQWSYIKVNCLGKVEARKRYKKKLLQLNKDGVLIKEWESLQLAADTLKINKGNIGNSARKNGVILVGGFRWKYD